MVQDYEDIELELEEDSRDSMDHYVDDFIFQVENAGCPTDKWFGYIKEASADCGKDIIKHSAVLREILEHRFTERWAKFCRCWIRQRLQAAGFEELEDGGASIDDGRMSCMDSMGGA